MPGPRPAGRHPAFRVGVPRRAGRRARGPTPIRRRRAPSPSSRCCSPAARCAQWLGAPPPSLAEVERVLAVAAGGARVPPELAGGRAVRRHAGRALHWTSTSFTRRGPEPRSDASSSARTSCRQRIAELGKEITADYEGRPPLLVGVLKGAFVFMSDLVAARSISRSSSTSWPCRRTARPPASSGVVRILKDLDLDLTDRARPDRRGHRRLRAHARVPAQEPRGAGAGVARGVRAPGEGRPPDGRPRSQVRRVHDPARVRRRLRPRRRRALPQPAVRRRVRGADRADPALTGVPGRGTAPEIEGPGARAARLGGCRLGSPEWS